VEHGSSAAAVEVQSHYLVAAVVTVELVRVVEEARVGHRYDFELV
jgi:hypothetical protein